MLLTRLKEEIASLERNPKEKARLCEVRQDCLEYEKIVHEHSSTASHLIELLGHKGNEQNEDTAGGKKISKKPERIETLLSKTIADFMRDGLALKLDALLQE